jgi:hypothetical protein
MSSTVRSRRLAWMSSAFVALTLVVAALAPTRGLTQAAATDQPLPTRMVIDVNAPTRTLYRIAIPNLLSSTGAGAEAAETVRNDLKLVSLFNVLNP